MHRNITFYYPKELFDEKARWHIFPLLKSLLKEEHNSYLNFSISEDFDRADYIILPMSWNYYYHKNMITQVLNHCNAIETKIISFVFGDFGVNVPSAFKGRVYRSSGLKSKLSNQSFGLPIFIEDPLVKYYSKNDITNRAYTKNAIVGFCGQAVPFGMHSVKEILKKIYYNIRSFLGKSHRGKDWVISTSHLRYRILASIKKSNKVKSNFILRRAYRAGVQENKDDHSTTLEFYTNILDSHYVVCIRGAGNFSTRFYETLAMGRIPVFLNTDCLLPLSDRIDWESHVVWVEYKDRHHIADRIAEFHNKHDESSLNQLFLANRKLWENHLRLYHFFNESLNEY